MRIFRLAALIILTGWTLGAQPPGIEGSWEGPVKTMGGEVHLRLHVTRDPSGALAAKMDVPEQGAFGLTLDSVTFAEGKFHWGMQAIRASFDGTLNAEGTTITGTFTQGLQQPLVLHRIQASAGRPQDPKPPLPYKAIDVTFPSKAQGVTMAGTLTLPAGAGPFPAVILITGSGPQDRDEALMGHRPFLVLADYLTRHGIAVLRYDDRGVGKSTGNFASSTGTDFSYDAEGALDYLKTRAEIDHARIGMAGHSEGGILAPMVAARRADVAFVVMLAGTGVPGKEVMKAQAAKMLEVSGAPPEAAKKNTEIQDRMFAALASEKDPAALKEKIREALAGVPNAEAQLQRVTSPWTREFAFYDPATALERVKCPVLAVNGEKDLQVLPDQNLPPIEAALKKGGNKDYRIVRLPDLNHLFQHAKTGLVAEYGQIDETMAPVLLETVTNWIRQHTGLEKPQ